jgi:uncharacterized protein (TIGR02265 family)
VTQSWRQVANEPIPPVGHTFASAFEALFLKVIDTPPELARALSGIDVDLENLQPRYPSTVWVAAIDLARSYLYATSASREVAERELGRKLFAGFVRTVSGRLFGAALPLLTVSRFLRLAGRYVTIVRDDLFVDAEDGHDGGMRLLVVDPAEARPYFFAGTIEASLERLNTPFRIEVHPFDPWRFELHVNWSR